MFKSSEDWYAACDNLKSLLVPILKLQGWFAIVFIFLISGVGKIGESAENLASLIKAEDDYDREYDRVRTYANHKSDENTSDSPSMRIKLK